MLSKAQFAAIAETDFLAFDMLEDCEYESKNDDGTYATAVEFQGLARRGELEDEAFIAAVAPGRKSLVWHGLTSEIGDAKIGDRITGEDGRKWQVWYVATETGNARYRMRCVELHEPV